MTLRWIYRKKQIFMRAINKKLEIFYSNCNLSFSISDDIRARSFISDLENTIFGYIIIKNLSII